MKTVRNTVPALSGIKSLLALASFGLCWMLMPVLGRAAELPVLKNADLEIKFTPAPGYGVLVYDTKTGRALVASQFLEISPVPTDPAGSVLKPSTLKSDEVVPTTEKDRSGVKIVQDGPLFEISKEVVLEKNSPDMLLRYTFKIKQDFDFKKPFPVSAYFIAGNDTDRIGWRTPSGMQWVARDAQAKARTQTGGTDAVGAGFGRFVALQAGEAGPALIMAAPGKAQKQPFNVWRYEFAPGPDQKVPYVIGFKSGMLTLSGPIKQGEVFVMEWRLRMTAAAGLDKAVDSLFAGYSAERAEIAAIKAKTTIPVLPQAPIIDGKLDDPVWAKASSLSGFVFLNGGFPASNTEAKLLSANGKLYLGITCRDKDLAHINAKHKEHDGNLWEDDGIEIFLAPPEGTKFFQFILNSMGAKFEQKCDNWGAGQLSSDKSWDIDWNVKTVVDKAQGLWTAEVELPLSAMGLKPELHSSLRMNLNRNQHGEAGTCWSPTYGGFQNLSRFGTGVFSKNGVGLAIDSFSENPEFLGKLTIVNPADTQKTLELKVAAVDNNTQDGFDYVQTLILKPGEARTLDVRYKNLLMERVKNKLMVTVSDQGDLVADREIPLNDLLGNKKLAGYKYPGADGTIFWTLFTDDKIFKTDQMTEASSAGPLVLDAAKGEQESFQLVIASPAASSFTLESSDLTSGKNSIPAKDVKIYRQRYVTTKTVSDSYGFLGDWPDPLPEESTLVSEPNANTPAWITVRVPREAEAGFYQGTITVTENGKAVAQIPFGVKVRKFALPARFSQEFPVPDPGIFRNEYNMDTASGFNFLAQPELVNGKIVIPLFDAANKQKFEEGIAFIKKYNPRHFSMWMGHLGSGSPAFDFLGTKPGTPEYYARLKEYFTLLYNKFKEYGLEKQLAYYIYDEPSNAEIPLIKEVAKIVHSVSPNIFIYGALYTLSNMDDESKKDIDGWFMPPGTITPEFLKWAREKHKTPMTVIVLGSYPYPTFYIDAPILSLRMLSWYNWKVGADVITSWHSYHSISSDNPYANPATFSRSNGEGMIIWPSGPPPYSVFTNGIWTITSIRIEMIRDGMEDYEYLKMLSDLIKTEKNPELKQQAQKVMAEADALVVDAKTYDRNAADYRLMKSKMGDMIEKML